MRGLFVSRRIAADAQVAQNLGADAVVALVGLEAEALVRLDRVEALVLQLVRANLVGQADAASFLVEIQQHASPFRGDALASPRRAARRSRSAPSERRRR